MKHASKFIAAALLLLLLLGYFHPTAAFTQDLGRHILTGDIILRSGHVPETNLYSYTFPDFPFINHHWGSEVLFAILFHLAGMPGLFLLMLCLIASAFLIQLVTALKHSSPLGLGIPGLLAIGVMLERTDLRPELFSFLLLSVFLALLFRNRDKPTRLLFLLIPLQLLWVNLHIYFAIGLIVIGLFLLDAVNTHRKKLLTPAVTDLVVLLSAATLASLLNPHGLTGLLYPLHVFQNYGYTIEENQTVFLLQSLGFQKPSFPYFFLSLLLLFTGLGVNYKKTKPIDWLLSLTFSYLAFSAVRNFPLFAIATFVPFSRFFSLLLTKLPPFPSLNQYRTALVIGGLACLYLWQGSVFAGRFPLGYGVTPGAEKAVDFVEREHVQGPMFNNFDIGSYLIYRLYPRERVFVDGRPEAYPATFFTSTYMPMQQDPAFFTQVAEHYHFRTIFFSHTDQTPWGEAFLKAIVTDPTWTIVYLDDYVILLLKNTPANDTLIQRFGMTREHLRITKAEDTLEANLRLASFFSKVGWVEEGLPYYLAILKEKPNFCPALALIGQVYQQQNNPAGLIYAQQYNAQCL